MKNKNQKMEILKGDLIKYSKQIGIIDCEIPELVFYGEDFKAIHDPPRIRHGLHKSRVGGRHTGFRGLCGIDARVILVNIRGKNQSIRELRHTLVHELIHYRFSYMSHTLFEDRIKKILKGKQYPRKHITCPEFPLI